MRELRKEWKYDELKYELLQRPKREKIRWFNLRATLKEYEIKTCQGPVHIDLRPGRTPWDSHPFSVAPWSLFCSPSHTALPQSPQDLHIYRPQEPHDAGQIVWVEEACCPCIRSHLGRIWALSRPSVFFVRHRLRSLQGRYSGSDRLVGSRLWHSQHNEAWTSRNVDRVGLSWGYESLYLWRWPCV